ncbi:MAG: cellulose biosynthesis protein BcsG [Paralcaligenes sp.]
MASWNLYFLLKLFLYFKGNLAPLWGANILFILILILPIERRWIRAIRLLLALSVAIPLLYYESFLPPFSHALEQLRGIMSFDSSYMRELAERFVPVRLLWTGALAIAIYYMLNRWIRFTSLVLIAFISIPAWHLVDAKLSLPAGPVVPIVASAAAAGGRDGTLNIAGGNYEAVLKHFRETEAPRRVIFKPADPRADARFDIIMIHICSLSWDDLKVAKGMDNPLLSHFDYLFTHFSGAVSYSGPAAIRLLRADCGQTSHKDIYKPDSPECHIFSVLQREGYTPQIALNHDGLFDDFIGDVTRNMGVPGLKKMSLEGVPAAIKAFDGSPIRDDLAVLDRWWAARQNVQGPVALYYNTITLHDGNHLVGTNSQLSSVKSYPIRLAKLMSDVDQFAAVVKASGRKAVLVFVPEHGAALEGEPGQIAGLRDIPTPKIINLPVGIRLINFTGKHEPTQIISAPSSYLALAQLLANMVADSPFKPNSPPLIQYSANLPQTAMVGENEGIITLPTPKGYAMRDSAGNWTVQNE